MVIEKLSEIIMSIVAEDGDPNNDHFLTKKSGGKISEKC